MKKFRFALIGHNVTYSKSADIFKAIFDQENIHGSCQLYSVEPNDFDKQFSRLTSLEVDGLSVTIPYKKSVIPYLNEIDPIAEAIDAVNSIYFKGEQKFGYNTDCYGFSFPIQKHASLLKNSSALIFGAGGAAKAVLYALYTDYEIRDFTVVARDKSKLFAFQESFEQLFKKIQIRIISAADVKKILQDKRYSIAVNCTPLGGWNQPDKSLFPASFDWSDIKIYYDLNYNADNTIIAEAKTNMVMETFDGSAMLVAQAVRSFFLWTGIKTDFKKVYDRVFG